MRRGRNRFANIPPPPAPPKPAVPKPSEEAEPIPYTMEPVMESYTPVPPRTAESRAPNHHWQPMIQIRPDPYLTTNAAPPAAPPSEPRKLCKQRWYRWLVVYIPSVVVVLVILYIVSELLLKHLAFRNLQQTIVDLPETPPPLSFVTPTKPSSLPPGLTPLNLDALSLPRTVARTKQKTLRPALTIIAFE